MHQAVKQIVDILEDFIKVRIAADADETSQMGFSLDSVKGLPRIFGHEDASDELMDPRLGELAHKVYIRGNGNGHHLDIFTTKKILAVLQNDVNHINGMMNTHDASFMSELIDYTKLTYYS